MKKIIIYQENKEIELMDNDSEDVSKYTKELSKIINNTSNVYILETTTKNLILKPSSIISISVEELNSDNKKPEAINKKEDDIITD